MARRIMSAVARTLRAGATRHDDVHFHNDGPTGRPAPCFDARCPRPRLDVR